MISGLPTKNREPKHGFLQFSKKLDYGLFLLIELARRTGGGPLSLQTVAQENGMSFFFLQKSAFLLRKGGLVISNRGKNGGYVLGKSASVITLKEIVEVLEGPVNVMHCLMTENSNCMRQTRCRMRHGLGAVNEAILNIFTQTTLDHLLQPTWKQPA